MRGLCGAVVAALVLSLTACGGSGPESKSPSPDGTATLKTSDGVELTAPSDWKAHPDKQQGSLVLVAQGSNKTNQLFVTKFDTKNGAKDEALFKVTGLTSGGVDCKPAELDGRQLFDCPAEYQGEAFRRLFFALENGDESYLVLIQTPGATLDEAAKTASPIIDSITF